MKRHGHVLSALAVCAVVINVIGCQGCVPLSREWKAKQILTCEGLNTPECVCIDPETGTGYISNIVAPKKGRGDERYWTHDGTGFITRLSPGGARHQDRWAVSVRNAPLGSLKGMCVLEGVLYGADVDRVARYSVETGQPIGPIAIPGAKRLNDMATDGKFVYVSDTELGKVFRLRGDDRDEIKAPVGVNGIAFHKGKLFAVSGPLHEVFELDPEGKAEPQPFGLADQFTALDGIEVLPDGSFLVSDHGNDRVRWIDAGRKMVVTLIRVKTPADIGLDRERMLLFVPSFLDDRVTIYELRKR
jgi:hypothetical protein